MSLEGESEDEFIKKALGFLEEIGADTSTVDPEVNLIDSGVLDSLGTLAFLDFLEEQKGKEIEVETLSIESISTLRKSYRFVLGE